MRDYRDIIGGELSDVRDPVDATLDLGHHLSEAVRGLNHTTATDHGLRYASTVYTVLGRIADASFGLDQTLQQLQRYLTDRSKAGRLAHDDHRDPTAALATAGLELDQARTAAHDLHRATAAAQTAISDIHNQPAPDPTPTNLPAPQPAPTDTETPANTRTPTIRDVLRKSLEQPPTHPTDRPPEPPTPSHQHGRSR